MEREQIIRMAREQGLPETEVEGVFMVNSDDLGRMLAAERERLARLAESQEDDAGYHSLSAAEIRAGRIGAAKIKELA
jgi:hypothetical protein